MRDTVECPLEVRRAPNAEPGMLVRRLPRDRSPRQRSQFAPGYWRSHTTVDAEPSTGPSDGRRGPDDDYLDTFCGFDLTFPVGRS